MRILHTSDWHLGQELYGHDRGPEHDVFLQWLLETIDAREVDALIITGDIYDVGNPPIEAQQRFYRFLNSALSQSDHMQIVVIGGNHDSGSRVELPKALLPHNRVYLVGGMPRAVGVVDPAGAILELKDKYGVTGAVCAAIPYLRPGDLPAGQSGSNPVAQLYAASIQAANQRASGVPVIATGHLHIAGGAVSELSERRIFVGGEEAVSADIFPSDVAYVALGHLHNPQLIPGSTLIRYAGSPFPLSSTERGYEHSVVLLDLSGGGSVPTLIRTPRPVPFLRVPNDGFASLAEIESLLAALPLPEVPSNLRPFLEIAITMDSPIPDLRQRIDAALQGKPVRLTRLLRQSNAVASDGQPGSATKELSEFDPLQVFVRRYMKEYGVEPPEPLKKAFLQLVAALAESGPDQTASGAA